MTNKALTVPAVALGTWAWGDSEAGDGYFGSPLSESGLREVVEKARSNGLTLWDTAVAYGMGRSGTVLAQALTGHHRSEYQLSTKFTVEAVQNHYSLLHRSSERGGILDHCREHDVQFFSCMVLEQGALTGRYTPANPLPEGSNRAAVYNGILPQLQSLTDRMGAIGKDRGASAADVAAASASAKGTTPIIGVTKAVHIDGVVRARGIALADEEIAELEALADAADIDTRDWWEHEM
ncbi:aldo/keto reductase [Streptomyces sp. NPDC045369]|uniref:aldo/keto reductase n=1 Tax=Streptomyces sp. NPDC045369 TaxID=3155732 RepID=UPI0033C3E9DB